MQKRSRARTLSRHLSERARDAAPAADMAGGAIADLGGAAAEILGRLRDVFEQVAQAADRTAPADDAPGAGAAERGTGDIPFTIGGKQGRMVFGYTMRMGLDGLKAEPFGDMPPAPAKAGEAMKPAARAPIVDVFEEAETIRIIAELPGAGADDIVCTLDGTSLLIETRAAPRYNKTLTLPCAVVASSLRQSCSNGILEICLDRARP